MGVTTRLAQPEDNLIISRLAAETFPLACPPGTRLADIEHFIANVLSPENFANYLADPDRFIVLAYVDQTPVGYTMVHVIEPADEDVAESITLHPTAELSKCYVLPGYHGRGMATSLMQATIAEARNRGVKGIWLGVNQHNAKAIVFYQKHDFTVVGTKTFLVGMELHDDHVMELPLSAD